MASTSARTIISVGIAAAALAIAFAPSPGGSQSITVVAGSELQEPLMLLERSFERANPNVAVELKFQGSQDMVNRYVDDKNDFEPTILMPANGELLNELSSRWEAQNNSPAFKQAPQAIAKTQLVAIAWPERGQALFPSGQFSWQRLQTALEAKTWDQLGGEADWGSFDFRTTDPSRSNSGQLTLSLWSQAATGTAASGGIGNQAFSNQAFNNQTFAQPAVQTLFSEVKQAVYQPPRSTDILLQEFIARGPNDADVATVYESIALHRWQQSDQGNRQSYQIYYLNPTIETVATGAIVERGIDGSEAKAAQHFLDYLAEPEQQAVFVQHGFRSVDSSLDITQVSNSPWQQNIPGAMASPAGTAQAAPDAQTVGELVRAWQRAQ